MEQHKTGTLYLCATPIGNLEELHTVYCGHSKKWI